MRKICVLFTLYVLVCHLSSSPVYADIHEIQWSEVSLATGSTNLCSLAVSPSNPDVVFVSSYKTLYKTVNGGRAWMEILSFRGSDNSIYSLATDNVNPQIIYAGTAEGLFRSSDQGVNWERIYKGMGMPENTIFAITVSPDNADTIYIGTVAGIFFTEDRGRNWQKGQNLPYEIMVTSIIPDADNPRILFAASARGIYKSVNSGVAWDRVYKSDVDEEYFLSVLKDGEEDSEEMEITELRNAIHIRKILIDPKDGRILYAGTARGLLVTDNGGSTWTRAGSIGLVSHNIRDIAVTAADSRHLYAATDRGIFRYAMNTQSWEELYNGIISSDIRYLGVSAAKKNRPPALWAATGRGLYKSSPLFLSSVEEKAGSPPVRPDTGDRLPLFNHEPTIEEIREAAIEYAEVSPDKIRTWRKAAAYRALLPDVRFAYDKGKDWQNSYSYYKVNDEYVKYDDITNDKDTGWSVSLSWALGDLIWNSAQTSIDSRSKLLVQLRDDVLNEVTRVYFERRRLQIDIALSPPSDNREKMEKDLRLQELTAIIDALTGSYLSKRLLH